MWLKDLFEKGRRTIAGEYPSAGERDALLEVLCADVLHLQPYSRLIEPFLEISESDSVAFLSCARRLSEGEPLQYITGWAEFYGRRFCVSPAVLVPRSETEELCRMVIEDFRGGTLHRTEDSPALPGQKTASRPRILDLCTGSGCIAWTLALELPGAEVWGLDISEDALKVAAGQPFGCLSSGGVLGKQPFGCSGRSEISGGLDSIDGVETSPNRPSSSFIAPHFVKYDVLQDPERFIDSLPGGGFDAIVSNPPYVRESERPLMRRNVLEHEPSLALFVPDSDPLKFYRAVRRWTDALLLPGGRVYLEQNEALSEETAGLFSSYSDIRTEYDLSRKPRFTLAQK